MKKKESVNSEDDGRTQYLVNAMVLDKMFNTMVTEIKQYIGYIKDASSLPDPIDRPRHMTSKKSIKA